MSSRLLSKNLKIKIYKTKTLPVALYRCEAWSLTLREECRLRALKKRIPSPRGMRMRSGEDSTHNEELHSLYRSPKYSQGSKYTSLKWAVHVGVWKRPLRRPRRRREDNIRMDLKEIGINTRNCVDSAQDRGSWRALVNTELIRRVP